MGLSYTIFTTTPTGDSAAPPSEGVAASSTNTYYSKPWSCEQGSWSLQVQTTGTLTGTWTLWLSNKPHPSLTDDTDWVDISTHAGFVETNPAGATTKWTATPDHLIGAWFRLKYVNASGTGNILAWVCTQGL